MRRLRPYNRARLLAARQEGLSFPEPFFWTTDRLERLRQLDPGYRDYLHARALDALKAPPTRIRVVAEGDSWFNHPCLRDIMDWFQEFGYAAYRSDAPGRELATMVQEQVYLKFLADPAVPAALLSGGGNDLISWKRDSGRRPSPIFKPGNGSSNPADYLNDAELGEALAALERLLGEFARSVHQKRPGLPIITHCYDRIEPRSDGPVGAWVGPQMDQLGVPKKQRLRNGIAAILIDRANETYGRASAAHGMTYVDLRGTVRNRWWDEIHPKDDAFREVATRLAAKVPASRASGHGRRARGRGRRPGRGAR